MDRNEKTILQAACIQAAAIMLAPLHAQQFAPTDGQNPSADTLNCARHARDLFEKVTGEPWDEPGRASDGAPPATLVVDDAPIPVAPTELP